MISIRTISRLATPIAAIAFAVVLAWAGAATAQRLPENVPDQEAYTDPAEAEGSGFRMLQFDGNTETGLSALIAKQFVAKMAAELPEPAPGYAYSLTDLDGDGGPELFIRIMHWKLCELGCPVHIYRFDLMQREWKEMFSVNASLLGVRPPRKKGERPEIAALSDGPGGRGPTTTTYYRWDRNDKFVKIEKGDSGKRRKGR